MTELIGTDKEQAMREGNYMEIQILQHEEPEVGGSGVIEQWAEEKNHTINITRVDLKESYPPLNDFDFLIILGGGPGAYEEGKYPWLRREKAWIKTVIEEKKYVLGICLGAQLIADAMGGKASKHDVKEIGWWQVKFNHEGQTHLLLKGLPKEGTFYQFHQDTFTIPNHGTHLAESIACKSQAFSIGNHVLALQFHPEMTKEMSKHIIEASSHNLKEETPYVQTIEQLLEKDNYQDSQFYMYKILNNFEAQINSGKKV